MKNYQYLLILTLIFGFLSESAIAYDSKTLPGIACVDADNQNDVSYHYNGYIRNKRSTANVVYCPILRDVTGASANHFWSVGVNLYKTKSSAVRCYLDSRNSLGSSGTWKSTSASGIGYRTAYFPAIGSHPNGTFNVSCTLGGGDRLQSINYIER